ncbi:MAG: peptidylprolyl isomerase [Saprospiraceae bacterium]
MIIEANKVVSLHYRLQKDDSNGELVEETFGSDPLTFLFGAGQMIPDFENNLAGKKAGDEFAFGIESKNAYGEFNPEAVVVLPMSTFMVDGKLAEEFLQVGKTIPMSDQNGNRMNGVVKEVKEDGVQIDFNHPMAGQDLYFTGKIESLRAATAEELEHGHVHGPGGHDH